jgi:RimJ/RimL family protein N-acetyltransferase
LTVAEGELELRPLARDDFPLVVDWLAQPHVGAWWGAPLDLAGVEKEYGPCIDRTDPTEVFICSDGTQPMGLVQIYRLADHPEYERAVGVDEAAGIDLLIGDLTRCGHGAGPRIIGRAAAMSWEHYPEVRWAMAGPSVRNTRSHRAFEKAGFRAVRRVAVPNEEDDELIFVCPRPTDPRPTGG